MLKTIIWDADSQTLNPIPDTADANARRFRAKEVLQSYKYAIYDNRVVFGSTTVMLTGEGVSCTCPDFTERSIKMGLPCKHIFAAAFLKGDKRCTRLIPNHPSDTFFSLPKNTHPVDPSTQNQVWRIADRPQNVRVGKHFMLSDFLYSETVAIKGHRNCPPLNGMEIDCLMELCANILDPVVEQFGSVSITYGYSSPQLHQSIYGGRSMGLHNCIPAKGATMGAAADILVHSMKDRPRDVLLWIKNNCVFDRLIIFATSQIVCTAWSNHPRHIAKEWVFLPSEDNPQYINLSDTFPLPK